MDLVTLAMAKQYTDSQRLGRKETYDYKVYRETNEPDFIFLDMPLYRLTPVCPSDEEIPTIRWESGEGEVLSVKKTEEWYDLGPASFGGLVAGEMEDWPLICMFVREEGSHTITVPEQMGGGTQEVDFPPVGIYMYGMGTSLSCRISWTHIEKIPAEYIPVMDAIILNGADGKKYSVTVNESGALTAMAVE